MTGVGYRTECCVSSSVNCLVNVRLSAFSTVPHVPFCLGKMKSDYEIVPEYCVWIGIAPMKQFAETAMTKVHFAAEEK